jgi:branched-chain amino acid transport system permease protein
VRVVRPLVLLATTVALALGPWWLSEASTRNLVEFFCLLAIAQMWNLLAGFAGLVSIGQQAFVGFGAYALYGLADRAGLHPFFAVALAGLAAAAVSIPTAALAFRLRGGYFAIGTWVIAEVYHLLAVNMQWVGGGDGTLLLSAAQIDRTFRAHGTYFWALGIGVGSVVGSYALLRSRLGLALTAIRDEETAARSAGVDVLRAKVIVWVIAAFGCGLAGAVYHLNILRVQPDAAFTVNWSAYMIFIVVIGGIGTVEGPIVGAVVFFALQQKLSGYGGWYLIILGAVAVLVAVWMRGGIWGVIGRRTGLQLFPVQRRVAIAAASASPGRSAPGGATAAAGPASPAREPGDRSGS